MIASSTEVPRPHLLDTSVYIDFDIVDLGQFEGGTPVLAAVPVGELAYGLQLGSAEQQAIRDALYQEAITDYEILPYGVEEAKALRRAGHPRPGGRPQPPTPPARPADRRDGGAARLPLLTCNPTDFVGADRLVEVVPVSRSGGVIHAVPMANWGSLLRQVVKVGTRPAREEAAAGRQQARSAPAGERARAVVYAPDLDGAADPGEIVWAWVPFEENDGRGKDRPLLVVGRGGGDLLGLMLSSQHSRDGDPDWVSIGSGGWDRGGPRVVRPAGPRAGGRRARHPPRGRGARPRPVRPGRGGARAPAELATAVQLTAGVS